MRNADHSRCIRDRSQKLGASGAALLLTLALGCAPPTPSGKVLLLGAVIDHSGSNAEPSWGDAVLLAQHQMNEALVAAGHSDWSFKIIVNDSRNDPPTALSHAVELVKNQHVKALVLDNSQNVNAINALNYGPDSSTALNVPLQCTSCTSNAINNPTATNADPVQQLALRNGQRWVFRTVMSSRLMALIVDRDLIKLGTPAADVNGDGKVKIAVYNSDEAYGNSAATDLINFAMQLQTNPPVIIEQRKHPGAADINLYDWATDLELLTNDRNDAAGKTDAIPDYLVTATFAQYHVPIIKTWRVSAFEQRVPKMAHFHNLRIQSAVNALGNFADGQDGVSLVLLDGGISGETFKADYAAFYQKQIHYRDAHYYDNAMTLMLGMWRAAHALADPNELTGEQVKLAMPGVEDTNGLVVHTGIAEYTAAIRALDSGATINYEGASGPLDYDANQNIKDKLTLFRVRNQQFEDLATYDCIVASNSATAAALSTACPFVPPR